MDVGLLLMMMMRLWWLLLLLGKVVVLLLLLVRVVRVLGLFKCCMDGAIALVALRVVVVVVVT